MSNGYSSAGRQARAFSGLQPMDEAPELQPVVKVVNPAVCEYCGWGNFKLRLVKLHEIRTRQEKGYIVKNCKQCEKDQMPVG